MTNKFIKLENDTIHVQMGTDDWQEIVINNEIHLHVRTDNSGAYSVDVYKYSQLEEPLEDDLIHSFWANRDDLITEITVIGTNNEEFHDYYLLGNKLYCENEIIEEEIKDTDTIVRLIKRTSGTALGSSVKSIELDGEVIFKN